MPKFLLIFLGTAFLLAVNTMPAYAGVAPHKHEKEHNKERIKDGVYQHQLADHMPEYDHEIIVGNAKEAKEFDQLSPEESKRRLAILIKFMDLNNDQFIDRHELKAWIVRSFKKLAEEEATDRFEEIDEDKDNFVTWKEFLFDVYGLSDDQDHKKQMIDFDSYEQEQRMIKEDKELWAVCDLNQDTKLDLEEFIMYQNPEEYPATLPLVLQHTMQNKDQNNDGKIDFKEFVANAPYETDKSWLITEKDRFDNDFDANGDGVLSGNEVLSWVVPSDDVVARDEVDHLFVSTDDDHDDRLSFIEILNNYETFVGSEATDYGDHLQNIHRLNDEL